jgi:hypothetical protein
MKPTFLCLILLAIPTSLRTASAQSYSSQVVPAATNSISCATNVTVTPTLRAEGTTEMTGDITLNCTGGTLLAAGSQIPSVNITVFLNTTVTSKLKSFPGGITASEALLLIDEPNSGLPGASNVFLACNTPNTGCVMTSNGTGVGTYSGAAGHFNVFQGVVTGNQVTFFGVPVDPPPPGGSRVLRLTNIRANASALAGGSAAGATPVVASISVSGATSLLISNPTPTVGFVASGLAFSLRDGANATPLNGSGSIAPASGPVPTGTPSVVLRFGENFGTSLKPRTIAAFGGTETSPAPAIQNVPGTIYNSETGFTLNAPSITAAPADSGTRLKAAFDEIPAGVTVWVGIVNTGLNSQKAARLIIGEAAAFSPFPVSATVANASVAQLPIVNGSAIAIWEALGVNPNTIDNFDFPVWFTGSGSVDLSGIHGTLAPNPLNGAISSNGNAAASASLPVPRFADPFAQGPSRVISQMVDGGAWKTTIILVNTDTQPVNFTLRFWDETGVAQSLPLGHDGLQAQLIGTIPSRGSRTIQTDGLSDSLTVVWAELISTNSIGGFAVFRQRVDGRPDQEAAVPLASSLGRFVLPFDNTQGFVTSMALVNTNLSQSANAAAAFRGEDGGAIVQAPINLAARGHTAFALPDVIPNISNRRGVAEFSSANPDLTALGLRFSIGGAFTSFPVLSFLDPTLNAPSRSLSQLVDGGGWKTTFVFSNMDTTAVTFTLHFWKDDGTAFRLQFEGAIGGASDTFVATIPVGGSLTLITRGVDADVSQGWAELATTKKLGGLAVFRQTVAGRSDQEAAVQLTTSVSGFILPFDNTQGFVTSMALVNSNAINGISVSVTIRDETGLQIGTGSLVVGPRGHGAFALPDQFPVVANRRGTVEFSSTSADLSGLGLRFNPGGAFTSFPVLSK